MNEMKLPVIEAPKYTDNVPSTGQRFEFRPFTVKEEKILLIAQESQDPSQAARAIRDIIKSCTFGKVNPNHLTMYDFEHIFLQLRIKSIGETAEIKFPCEHCEAKNVITTDLSTYKIKKPAEEIESSYQVNDAIGITIKHLTFKDLIETTTGINKDGNITDMEAMLSSIIETIYTSEEVFKVENFSKEEVMNFIQSLPHSALEYIKNFIENQPTVTGKVDFTCSECGKEVSKEITGLSNFF